MLRDYHKKQKDFKSGAKVTVDRITTYFYILLYKVQGGHNVRIYGNVRNCTDFQKSANEMFGLYGFLFLVYGKSVPTFYFKINKIVILAICHTVVTKVLECVIISVMVLMN